METLRAAAEGGGFLRSTEYKSEEGRQGPVSPEEEL